MANVSVTFFGIEQLQATINSFLLTFTDVNKMYAGALEAFFKIEEKIFESGGGEKRWQPLTLKYEAWKNKHYPALPIMQMTGALKDALTGKDPSSLKLISTGKGFDIYVLSAYWHNHQFGTTMPIRETVNFTEEDREIVIDSMLKATVGGRLSRLFSRR